MLIDRHNELLNAKNPTQTKSSPNDGKGKRFAVISEDGDYLNCLPLGTGVTNSIENIVLVAKPYLLRRSPFDGGSRADITFSYSSNNQRTSSDGSSNEIQVIVPSYELGDEIIASRVIGGSGVTNEDGQTVFWIDNNGDGRAWAKIAS